MIKFKKFYPKDKSTFPYWFWHMLAFNYVAWKCGHWRPWYIFHDIEKPFLLLLWKDYNRVRYWHKHNNRHHLFYGVDHGMEKCDYVQMVIDWESSHYTKYDCPLDARGELEHQLNVKAFYLTKEQKEIVRKEATKALEKLGL